MFISRGQIKIGDKVVLDDVLLHVSQVHGNQSCLGGWSGYFSIPEQAHQAYIAISQARDSLVVLLADGRGGDFHWTNIDGLGGGATVTFQGSGPLK